MGFLSQLYDRLNIKPTGYVANGFYHSSKPNKCDAASSQPAKCCRKRTPPYFGAAQAGVTLTSRWGAKVGFVESTTILIAKRCLLVIELYLGLLNLARVSALLCSGSTVK